MNIFELFTVATFNLLGSKLILLSLTLRFVRWVPTMFNLELFPITGQDLSVHSTQYLLNNEASAGTNRLFLIP